MSWLRSILESGPRKIEVIALTARHSEEPSLEALADRGGWHLTVVADCESAAAALLAHPGAVILCDRDLPGIGWREALHVLAIYSPASRFIVLSPETDDRFWLEVIRRGGYDVLTRPLHDKRAIVSVRQAANATTK